MKPGNKHLTWAGLVAAVLLAFGSQSATAAIGTIVGSKHDFSTSGTNAAYKGTGTQVCVYCHAPHGGSSTQPLWNRATQATQAYTMYASANNTLKATGLDPGPTSRVCLSCHDGTVAVDSFGGATGTKFAAGGALIGTDLSNDHPIGFTYNAALVTANPTLNAVSSAVTIGTGNTGTIESKMLFGTAGSAKMECNSCHDVHNTARGTAEESKLVRITTVGSALCTTCHIK